MAYLDGELDDDEPRAGSRRRSPSDPALRGAARRAAAAARRGSRRIMIRRWTRRCPSACARCSTPMSSISPPRAHARRPLWQTPMALAATLVLGLALGRLAAERRRDRHRRTARWSRAGALAEALDSQLASAQPADAATRIGVSFARARRQPVPDLRERGPSGLACREGDDWRMIDDRRRRGRAARRLSPGGQRKRR